MDSFLQTKPLRRTTVDGAGLRENPKHNGPSIFRSFHNSAHGLLSLFPLGGAGGAQEGWEAWLHAASALPEWGQQLAAEKLEGANPVDGVWAVKVFDGRALG